jgi:hypothetical protein
VAGAVAQPARRLLYLVHGAASYYHEAAYSLLSLWRQPGGDAIEIVVVTDDPAPLQALIGTPPQLQYLVYSREQRRHWEGAAGLHPPHEAVRVCRWAIDMLDPDGDRVWAFVDSDTAFTRPPHGWLDAVEQGSVVLHAQEGTIHGNRTHSRSQRRLDDTCRRQAIMIRGQCEAACPAIRRCGTPA